MSTFTTSANAFVREHFAKVDFSEFAETIVPPEFRNVDYADLNGVAGIDGYAVDGDNGTEWDFGRFADAATSA